MNVGPSMDVLGKLKDRLFAVLVTAGAQQMEWFGSFGLWFNRVSEDARSDLGKLILCPSPGSMLQGELSVFQGHALSPTAPIAQYWLQVRSFERRESLREFEDLSLKDVGIANILHSLIISTAARSDLHGGECGHINHD